MTKINAKIFLEIWEKVAQQEHLTDRGLSIKLGITPSAVTHWRTGRTTFVMPGVLDKLEKKLGYAVEFSEDGTWQLQKMGEELKSAEKPEQKMSSERDPRFRESLAWPLATRITLRRGHTHFEESGSFSPLGEEDLIENVWMRMDDDSMGSIIPRGSWLLVQKNAKPETGEIGLIAGRGVGRKMIGLVTINEDRYHIEPTKGKSKSLRPEQIRASYRVVAIAYPRDPERYSLRRKQRLYRDSRRIIIEPHAQLKSQEE